MNKCVGCGAILNSNKGMEGYTSDINNNLCERCFRIRNYNDYKVITKDNSDYINILNNIDSSITCYYRRYVGAGEVFQ